MIQTSIDWSEIAKMPQEPTSDQCRRVLDYMRDFGQITPLDALRAIGCMRLSQRIIELEELGWSIQHDWVRDGLKRYMSYRLLK